MNSRKDKHPILKYGLYALLAIVLCIVQNTPGFFMLWGYKPMLLVAMSVVIAIFEGELAGGLFGAFAGFLCDLYGGEKVGYTALMLFLCCVLVGLSVQTFMHPSAVNSVLFTFLTMIIIRSVSFFFVIVLPGHNGAGRFFFFEILPIAGYSAIVALLFYIPMRRLHQSLTSLF